MLSQISMRRYEDHLGAVNLEIPAQRRYNIGRKREKKVKFAIYIHTFEFNG
jgi:hypothetical protein